MPPAGMSRGFRENEVVWIVLGLSGRPGMIFAGNRHDYEGIVVKHNGL